MAFFSPDLKCVLLDGGPLCPPVRVAKIRLSAIPVVARLPGGLHFMKTRCTWANPDNPLYLAYHDEEWGVPEHDDRMLFEMLTLEGAQAGLSWETILKKREGYRKLFAGFEFEKVARFSEKKVAALLEDPAIVRNRLKVESTVTNAQAFIAIRNEFGSFDAWLWQYVEGRPIQNAWKSLSELPASTPLSDRLSKDLKKRGFRFVGSTICYAFMQAVGMANDHTTECFRWKACGGG